ncbi:hypothetical protein AMJ48_00730 [Parcubacteria bacterium DG_74_1]|nr:MAG: hypothetical protein AMJ48_00730 [Parcubacteria bacterium DG_74_1]
MAKKTRLIISIILIGLLAMVSSALAATRSSWPDTPGGHPFPDEGIPELIRYFYEWGISLGGLLVFIALLIAGFQYMSSTGNPAMMQEAKDRVKSAFIGLALLLGSWLILNTINPQFTRFPELVLDLSRVVETTTSTFAERSPYPCEWGYVFASTSYAGAGGYMEAGETVNESHPGGYIFSNGPHLDEPLSVQVWRQINCYGCTNCNEEYNPEDELMLPINQAIADCETDKLAAMTPAEIAAGKLPSCSSTEIIALVEEGLKRKYGGDIFVTTNDSVKGAAGFCDPYNVTSTTFDIPYSITIPKYFISDGNCTFQLAVGTLPWGWGGCGDRIAEIYGTYPNVKDYTDRDVECVTLVATPRGKQP